MLTHLSPLCEPTAQLGKWPGMEMLGEGKECYMSVRQELLPSGQRTAGGQVEGEDTGGF
jgi:hypothetical protein